MDSSEPDPSRRPQYRSGAVARMARMPVTTLRVWERRYRLTQAALSPSGQRLYSAADVQRLALIKQLTDLGHAIGQLAGLDMAALLAVQATHAQAVAGSPAALPPTQPPAPPAPWRVGVVGAALFRRLARDADLPGADRPLLQGPWTDPAEAEAACAALRARGEAPGLLLWHCPSLQPEAWDRWQAQAPTLSGQVRLGVVYSFASAAGRAPLLAAGASLLHEPAEDVALWRWLGTLGPMAPPPLPGLAALPPVPPRRWDDAALVTLAGLSTTMACECPQHIAGLLRQLMHFEAYSRECVHRSPDDAALHAHLAEVSTRCRLEFEEALSRVIAHEGLVPGG